ncbi:hypothetical protein [Micromonospora sp. NBRC 107095]|uniref:hypothetical protein n=1 Tax=Micromonospora sp. NBRC 107095 TaxID=3032209 RepID=UPI002552C6DD|nr:hypothetical protein [Micromonospora sp. NBRC 107095]
MKPEKTMDPVLEFAVKQFGTFLATRGRARAVRESLEAEIAANGAETAVVICLAGVDAMTISFADEFLGRLYSSLAAGDLIAAGVRLSGLNEETREAVSICLERRDLVAVANDGGGATLVGRTEVLQETFAAVLRLGELRALDLADALSITPQNANNRLKRLVEAGAVLRRQAAVSNRGGREFIYTVP